LFAQFIHVDGQSFVAKIRWKDKKNYMVKTEFMTSMQKSQQEEETVSVERAFLNREAAVPNLIDRILETSPNRRTAIEKTSTRVLTDQSQRLLRNINFQGTLVAAWPILTQKVTVLNQEEVKVEIKNKVTRRIANDGLFQDQHQIEPVARVGARPNRSPIPKATVTFPNRMTAKTLLITSAARNTASQWTVPETTNDRTVHCLANEVNQQGKSG
jgi:hypothetical protein